MTCKTMEGGIGLKIKNHVGGSAIMSKMRDLGVEEG